MNYKLFFQFVKDFKFPIQKIKDENYLNYILDLFEEDMGTRTEWTKLEKFIDSNFSGNSEEYLVSLYKTREDMIQFFKTSEKYQEFNTMKMDRFVIKDRPDVSSKNIYNCTNVGKVFLSIDLKQANFQALKYSGVLSDYETYEDFARKFTDLEYFIRSKHIRQIVFGQCNPSRHITVEKYIINEIRKKISTILPENYVLVFQAADECIWEIQEGKNIISPEKIKELDLGFSIKPDIFTLSGYTIEPKKSSDFYVKTHIEDNSQTLHCIPSTYYPVVLKLWKGKELCDYDYWFEYEGLRAKFNEVLSLKKIE